MAYLVALVAMTAIIASVIFSLLGRTRVRSTPRMPNRLRSDLLPRAGPPVFRSVQPTLSTVLDLPVCTRPGNHANCRAEPATESETVIVQLESGAATDAGRVAAPLAEPGADGNVAVSRDNVVLRLPDMPPRNPVRLDIEPGTARRRRLGAPPKARDAVSCDAQIVDQTAALRLSSR